MERGRDEHSGDQGRQPVPSPVRWTGDRSPAGVPVSYIQYIYYDVDVVNRYISIIWI